MNTYEGEQMAYVTIKTKAAPAPPPIRPREQDWRALSDVERAMLVAWMEDPTLPLGSEAAVVFARRHYGGRYES